MSFHYSKAKLGKGGKLRVQYNKVNFHVIKFSLTLCVWEGVLLFQRIYIFFHKNEQFHAEKLKKNNQEITRCFNSCLQFLPKQRF